MVLRKSSRSRKNFRRSSRRRSSASRNWIATAEALSIAQRLRKVSEAWGYGCIQVSCLRCLSSLMKMEVVLLRSTKWRVFGIQWTAHPTKIFTTSANSCKVPCERSISDRIQGSLSSRMRFRLLVEQTRTRDEQQHLRGSFTEPKSTKHTLTRSGTMQKGRSKTELHRCINGIYFDGSSASASH